MDFKNRKTQITIGVVVILAALLGWHLFGGTKQPVALLTEVAQDPVETIIGRELLLALEKMKLVKLDVAFFNDPLYKSLQDTTVEIPKQPIGRRDPFAPLPRSGLNAGL
jgi:hypothetical protein